MQGLHISPSHSCHCLRGCSLHSPPPGPNSPLCYLVSYHLAPTSLPTHPHPPLSLFLSLAELTAEALLDCRAWKHSANKGVGFQEKMVVEKKMRAAAERGEPCRLPPGEPLCRAVLSDRTLEATACSLRQLLAIPSMACLASQALKLPRS